MGSAGQASTAGQMDGQAGGHGCIQKVEHSSMMEALTNSLQIRLPSLPRTCLGGSGGGWPMGGELDSI